MYENSDFTSRWSCCLEKILWCFLSLIKEWRVSSRRTSSIIQCVLPSRTISAMSHTCNTKNAASPHLAFLTPGSYEGSMLSFITNTLFKHPALLYWYIDPVDWLRLLCFSPAGHKKSCLSLRLTSCSVTGVGMRGEKKKEKSLFSLQAYFWLQRNPEC